MRLFKKHLETTFGADPELVIQDKQGKLIHATQYFKADSDRNAIAGTDGDSSLVELRPRPYTDILELVAELQNIFKKIDEKLKAVKADVSLKAGHYVNRKPIGGHIHIGVSRGMPKGFKRHLVLTLDKILIEVVEPKLDDGEQAYQRRGHTPYGKRNLGDSHYKEPVYGVEYRPIGSWLHSPEVAIVYLGFTKMVYQALVMDLPVYRSPEKTLLGFIEKSEKFTKDVQVAIKVFADLTANRKGRLDWHVDILENWIPKGEVKNAK